jgi:uncharacterized protein (DUF302 family)
MDYTKTTEKPYEETVAAVEAAAARRSFRTLHIHRVDQTLAEKGFSIPPYSIIEVCNASYAYQVITKHPPVGMMLPCRIVVYEQEGHTVVMLMKPTLIAAMMPDQDFGSIPQDVEKTLMEVVDEAVA